MRSEADRGERASDKQFGKLAHVGFIEPTLTLIARPVCNLVMERLDNEFVSGFRKLPSSARTRVLRSVSITEARNREGASNLRCRRAMPRIFLIS